MPIKPGPPELRPRPMDARAGDGPDPVRLTRRALLSGTAAAATAGLAAPAAGQAMGEVPDFGGWFGADAEGGQTTSYTGVDDRRGEDAVTIEVGASGNGGPYAYGPTAVWVDPGTTITFEWTSNTHNVVPQSQPEGADWAGHEPVENSGFSFETTLETTGIYTYYCQPHLTLGMKGGIAVGDDVPMTSPPSTGGGGFTLPGGEVGGSFMGLMLGTAGLAAAIVLAGELHGAVTRDTDGPTSAHTTALLAASIGVIALVAVVARLLFV